LIPLLFWLNKSWSRSWFANHFIFLND
jgi:hypothetical protein